MAAPVAPAIQMTPSSTRVQAAQVAPADRRAQATDDTNM
jgi:hypothetical protein